VADDPSRREVICTGCALLAAGCQPATSPPPPADTDDTASPWTGTFDTDVTGTDPYPCEQDISPGAAGWTELPLSQYPELAQVDGWVAVNAGGREIVVAHVEQDCYVAILRACAHEGVPIDYRPERWQFVCPRHGAIYGWAGEKVAGPQPDGLPVYPVGRDGDSVWVLVS
jgi:cytochrome b6-f complex iron-sulfur subunit